MRRFNTFLLDFAFETYIPLLCGYEISILQVSEAGVFVLKTFQAIY